MRCPGLCVRARARARARTCAGVHACVRMRACACAHARVGGCEYFRACSREFPCARTCSHVPHKHPTVKASSCVCVYSREGECARALAKSLRVVYVCVCARALGLVRACVRAGVRFLRARACVRACMCARLYVRYLAPDWRLRTIRRAVTSRLQSLPHPSRRRPRKVAGE